MVSGWHQTAGEYVVGARKRIDGNPTDVYTRGRSITFPNQRGDAMHSTGIGGHEYWEVSMRTEHASWPVAKLPDRMSVDLFLGADQLIVYLQAAVEQIAGKPVLQVDCEKWMFGRLKHRESHPPRFEKSKSSN